MDVAAVNVEADLEPLAPLPDKNPGEDQAEIRTFLGRRNKIRLGAPLCGDYLTHLAGEGEPVPADLQAWTHQGYSVVHLRPTLTLLPGEGCAFVAVEFSIEFAGLLNDGSPSANRPIAYWVGPNDVLDQDTWSTSSKTTQEMGVEGGTSFAKLLAKVSQEDVLSRDNVRYIRRQYSFGRNFSEAGWRMRATPGHELAGDVTNLEVVVLIPPGAALAARFRVVADVAVHSAPDRWLTWVFVPSPGTALDAAYLLTPSRPGQLPAQPAGDDTSPQVDPEPTGRQLAQ